MTKIHFDNFVDPDPSMTSEVADSLVRAHRHCAAHRDEVLQSEKCGCFSCQSIFEPKDITDWIEETGGTLSMQPDPWTACCPVCGIDAVIGTASGFPADAPKFLKAMNSRWFGPFDEVEE